MRKTHEPSVLGKNTDSEVITMFSQLGSRSSATTLVAWIVWCSTAYAQPTQAPVQAEAPAQAPLQAQAAERPATWAQPVALEGVPNLFKVNDRLYRSAQPTAAGMQQLKQAGIQTIVNLRGFHTDRDEIGQTELRSEHIPMMAFYPERKDAVAFLKIVSSAENQPVLVHCQYGADRTGAMIALYRVAIEGWSKEEATREMTEGGYGFHAIWFNLPNWIRDLDVAGICEEAGIKPAVPKSNGIASDVFVIEVVDQDSQRGVPLVELETIAHHRFVTDSAGRAAIAEPDLVGRKNYFYVRSHGYDFAKDGFGYAGQSIDVVPGQKVTLMVQRRNLAERLYRLTGSGIYADSIRAGVMATEPGPAGEVIGCDSVMTAIYNDKLYWFWGDTNRPHYPLGGNFHITGATTNVDLSATIDEAPPKFDYFVDDQAAVRSVAKMPGEGPTWISAVTVLPPTTTGGQPQLLANYVKVRNQLDAYRWGFVVWDDSTQQFKELHSTDRRPPMFPESQVHTFLHSEQGQTYVYFCHPLPLTRVRATAEAFTDPSQYEGFSCLKAGTTLADGQLDRNARGQLQFAWKRNTPPVTQKEERSLIQANRMHAREARLVLTDGQSDRQVLAHSGTVYWNKYRQRWIMIAVEIGGESSMLGEVWYAEADRPEGPWPAARKILTHDKYSFYNPKHHPYSIPRTDA